MFTNWKNTVKISILPKAIYRVHAIPIKIPMLLFHRNRKEKFSNSSQTAKAIITEEKNKKTKQKKTTKPGGITLPDFKLNQKATGIRTVWYWMKERHIRPIEQNRELRKKINSCI